MSIVIENLKTNLSKEIELVNFTDKQINEILYFYVHRTNDYTAYIKE